MKDYGGTADRYAALFPLLIIPPGHNTKTAAAFLPDRAAFTASAFESSGDSKEQGDKRRQQQQQ